MVIYLDIFIPLILLLNFLICKSKDALFMIFIIFGTLVHFLVHPLKLEECNSAFSFLLLSLLFPC